MARVFLLLPLLLAAGCAELLDPYGTGRTTVGGRPQVVAPNVSLSGVRLARAPSAEAIARVYCSERFPELVCQFLGPLPTLEEKQFMFDVELEIGNPNPVAIPVASALFGFTAFPDDPSGAETLGSLCLTLCEDQTTCTQRADACQSNQPDIRTPEDFALAAVGFLSSVALGERRFEDLRVQTVPAGTSTRIVVRLGVDPEQMIRLLIRVFRGALDEARQQRRVPQIAVPYRIEGTVFVEVEGFGRFAAGFGPVDGSFTLGEVVRQAAGAGG
ncbi:MAG: hypothetical protein AAGH15_16790 [Myxococcota bacterium]